MTTANLVERVARAASKEAKERGITTDQVFDQLAKNMAELARLRKAPSGKYRVLEITNHGILVLNDYDTSQEAVQRAKKHFRRDRAAIHPSMYFAYDDKGKYIGGAA